MLRDYRCPECGHVERLDDGDWQEWLPACPAVVMDDTFDDRPDEEDLIPTCPGAEMQLVPVPSPHPTERPNLNERNQP